MAKNLPKTQLLHEYLAELLALKVDTVAGKGLSTNDYTTSEKNKLTGVETGATKYPDVGEEVYTTTEKNKLGAI